MYSGPSYCKFILNRRGHFATSISLFVTDNPSYQIVLMAQTCLSLRDLTVGERLLQCVYTWTPYDPVTMSHSDLFKPSTFVCAFMRHVMACFGDIVTLPYFQGDDLNFVDLCWL